MMGFSRRYKTWLTGSLVNTSLKLVMWMKKHRRQMKPGWPGVNLPLRPLYTGGVFVGLCWGHSRRTRRRNSTRPASHFILVSAGPHRQRLDPRGHSSDETGGKDPTMRHELPELATLPEQPWTVTVSCIGEDRMMYRSCVSWCCQKGYDQRSQWHGSSIDIKHSKSCMDPVLLALNCS